MQRKPIKIKNITKLKQSQSLPDDIADKWVNEKQKPSLPPSITQHEEEVRFTVVIPSYLHKRIKKYCAINATSMKKKLIQVLIDNFPEA